MGEQVRDERPHDLTGHVHEREPVRYAWLEDGQLVSGPLQRYARSWEMAYYSNNTCPTATVLTWDGEGEPVRHRVGVTKGQPNENDYIPYEISVGDDTILVSIDGRN